MPHPEGRERIIRQARPVETIAELNPHWSTVERSRHELTSTVRHRERYEERDLPSGKGPQPAALPGAGVRGNNFRHCNGDTSKGVSHGGSQQTTAIILSDRRRSGTEGQTNNRACKGVTPKGSATEEVRGPQPTTFSTGEGVECEATYPSSNNGRKVQPRM